MSEQQQQSASFEFSELTPDLILEALESINIWAESGLLALNSYENRVYQFMDDHKKRWVVKFYRPRRWSDAQILEEHEFTQDLFENEVPVVAPEIINENSLHIFNGYRFSLFPSVGGRQFEVDNLDQLEQVGRYIGRIHSVGQAKAFSARARFGTETHLIEPREILVKSKLVSPALETAFFTVLDLVIDEAQSRFSQSDFIRLHGDCHPSNILWRDGPSILDLDDCRMGPAVQDIWMMLSGDRASQLIQLETLIESYEEFCTFESNQLALIEPLRAMRIVHYMAWLTNRWSDPAFPRAFPWFATDKYWEQQILSLKEQVAALHEPALKLSPMY